MFYEIITFCTTFCGNEDDKKINKIEEGEIHISPIKVPLNEEEKKEEIKKPENNTRFIIVQSDSIFTKGFEQKFVNLKFRDNKNQTYELEVDIKRRFKDVLNELISKYDYLRKNDIRSVIYNGRYLYSTYIKCFETIEELRIDKIQIIFIFRWKKNKNQILLIILK